MQVLAFFLHLSKIGVFLQKLKCEYVDINRQGIKCKERKSKVLMRKPIVISDDKTSIIS